MKRRILSAMTTTTVLLCSALAFAQSGPQHGSAGSFSWYDEAICTNGNGTNLLHATTRSTWSGTASPTTTITAVLKSLVWPFNSCVAGFANGNTECDSTVPLTTPMPKNANAVGSLEGAMTGTQAYTGKHWYGSTLMASLYFEASCPNLQGACTSQTNPHCGQSPIIVPRTPGGAVQLTDAAAGVVFDIRGDGHPIRIGWIADDSASFLAVDRDGDGKITSGKELFGDATDVNATNGFQALLEYMDITHGGVIIPNHKFLDAGNPKWTTLRLWTDLNHNGISEPGELQPVGNVLTSIATSAMYDGRTDDFGNMYQWLGLAVYKTPTPTTIPQPRKPIWDVVFTTLP